MDANTLEALLTLGGVIYASTVTGLITLYGMHKAKTAKMLAASKKYAHNAEQEKARYKFIVEVSRPLVNLALWTPVEHAVEQLVAETSVDRVLLLTAVNGDLAPTHTSAVWQYRQNIKTFVPYVDQRIDEDYVNRLMRAKTERYLRFKLADIPADTVIARVLIDEGIVETVWVLLGLRKNADTKQVAYKYASFSTRDPAGFTDDVVREILIVATAMKQTIHESGFIPPNV